MTGCFEDKRLATSQKETGRKTRLHKASRPYLIKICKAKIFIVGVEKKNLLFVNLI